MTSNGLPSQRVPWTFDPEDLVVTRSEANRCLLGMGGWAIGAALLAVAALSRQWPLAIVSMVIGMPAVLLSIGLGNDVGWRLFPEGLSGVERYTLLSRLGQQWLRPSVIRRAIAVRRSTN